MNMKDLIDKAISFDESAELIAESEVLTRLDLGHAMVMRLKHPTHGSIIVLNSSVGKSAVLNS